MKLIKKAFNTRSGSRTYGRYRDYYDDSGFDAEEVREKLEKITENARFYIRHANMDEAVLIAQKMIETISDLWESNFDYEGDVQVMYDEAIDLLQEMLEDKNTSASNLNKKKADRLFNELFTRGNVTILMADMFFGAYSREFFDQYGISWIINFQTKN